MKDYRFTIDKLLTILLVLVVLSCAPFNSEPSLTPEDVIDQKNFYVEKVYIGNQSFNDLIYIEDKLTYGNGEDVKITYDFKLKFYNKGRVRISMIKNGYQRYFASGSNKDWAVSIDHSKNKFIDLNYVISGNELFFSSLDIDENIKINYSSKIEIIDKTKVKLVGIFNIVAYSDNFRDIIAKINGYPTTPDGLDIDLVIKQY